VSDEQVSKFHAFFRIVGDRVELSDAGSRNGTFVGNLRLEPKGPPRAVRNGEQVRFGHLEFTLLDAGACWDRLHV
jgi:pSer/pThr/pTyr-binding forkhead associated (FHA) protein